MDESVRLYGKWLSLNTLFNTKHVAYMKFEKLSNQIMLKMKF